MKEIKKIRDLKNLYYYCDFVTLYDMICENKFDDVIQLSPKSDINNDFVRITFDATRCLDFELCIVADNKYEILNRKKDNELLESIIKVDLLSTTAPITIDYNAIDYGMIEMGIAFEYLKVLKFD